jgi:hypothetical protein
MSGPQTLSDICSSFFVEWRANPLNSQGEGAARVTRRLVVVMSRRSQRQFTQDRTKWFAENPAVSRDCFPESRTYARLATP